MIANDRPLVVRFDGAFYFPIVRTYPETTFGGVFPTEAVYRDPAVGALIREKGWLLWPPIPFRYDTINYDLPVPAPAPPSRVNWLGTDDQGRDLTARLIYGFRISVLFGLSLTLLSSVIGVVAGAVQGYFGGLTDLLFQRFIEIWSGLPVLYLLIILASIVEPTFWWLLGLMLLFSWMSLVGVVRAEFLRARNFDYVRAARALGVRDGVIMFRHVLPNAMVATLTFLPFILSGSITTLTSLDFLGFGLPPGSPSLGEILAQGKANLQAPWLGITGLPRPGRDAEPPRLHRRGRPRRVRPAEDRVMAAAPLLAIRDLSVSFDTPGGEVRAVRGRLARHRQGGDRRARGRERVGEVRDRAVHPPAPAVSAGPPSLREHPLPGPGAAGRRRGDAPARPREPDRDDLPGADDVAQPAPHDREASQRGAVRPQGARPPRRAGADRWSSCASSACPRPSGAWTRIRTSSRAASASA